jgi:hypothetical protein
MVGPSADELAAEMAVMWAALMVAHWGNRLAERSAALTDNLTVDLMDVTTAALMVDTMVATMAATLVVESAVCLAALSVAE